MRGHVRKRGSKWCVLVDGARSADGRRKHKWFSGYRTKGEAEDALVTILGRLQRGETIDPDKTPLVEYLRRHVQSRSAELAPRSAMLYESLIRVHVEPDPIGAMPLGKVRRAHLRAFARTLEEKGLAASTRNVMFAVISKAFADAVEDDLLAVNPVAGFRGRARRSRAAFTVWTEQELHDLVDVVEDDELAALWRLAVATGARRSELLGLTWLGYDVEGRRLTISQQVVAARGGVTITPCKTAASHRTITLDEETVEWLERHREAQIAEKDLAGDVYEDQDLIFATALGRPLNPQAITIAFARHREGAGIRPGRLHDVRHTHATHLLTRGVPVHIVAARLGHASPVMTMTTYAHVLPTSDVEAADKIGELLAR